MRIPPRLKRAFSGALAILTVTAAVFVLAPTQAAQAQAGYRVCGVHDGSRTVQALRWSGEIGSGLVVKIANGGGRTCDDKLGFMKTYYGQAYNGSKANNSFWMVRCEDFGSAITGNQWDPCRNLAVNKIYKYSSKFDKKSPDQYPRFEFWNN
jgi:hypothetical protein